MKRLALLVFFLFLSITFAQEGILNYNSNQSDPTAKELDEMLVQMFMDANPDIQMEHTQVDHEGFKTAIRTYFASNNPPEVMTWFAANRMRFFAKRDLLLDIGDVWEENNWNDVYEGFHAMSQHEDKYLFVPTQYYWWGMYFRKDIFQELGINVPETWDQFLNTCDTLRENGYVPITIGTKYDWPAAGWFDYLNMRVNGPQFHTDLTDGKVPYTDERVLNVFNYWQELLDHDCFIENHSAYSWQEGAEFMIQEQPDAVMYLIGDFIRDLYPDAREDAELDFFRFPIIDPALPIGEDAPTDGFFAAAEADDSELAKRFLAFLGSKEAQETIAKELGRIAPRSDVDTSIYPSYVQKGLNEIINEADVLMQFYDRDTDPEMASEGMNGFVEFMSNPNRIDRILKQLERERAKIYDN